MTANRKPVSSRLATLAVAVALGLTFLMTDAQRSWALIEIDITQGNVDPMPIAVADFIGGTEKDRQFGQDIVGVINANLSRSGLFRPLARESHIEQIISFDAPPRFGDWRILNAQALVTGRIALQSDGRLKAEFRLWDVFAQTQLTGFQFFTTPRNWRRIGHLISDAVYQRLTGEKGYFDSRVVFVEETGPKDQRVKRLAMMDQDGANLRRLTNGDHLVLTPRFNPKSQQITYMSYAGRKPRVYLYNIETGQREIVGDFQGMTFAPRFSPDGRQVIMSWQREGDGNANIYTMDLRSRKIRRLTNTPAIDTGPSFSPDGQQIVFESDRGGSQQIYVMNADGSGQRRISFGNGRYSTPVWSPRGDMIAFTKMLSRRFLIGVMRKDGSGERILTEGYHNEGPTWSPNGRVLLFFRESRGERGGPQLWSVDLTGYNERHMETSNFASDPAWSPLMN